MKTTIIGILIVILYSFPFAFFSIIQDYSNHSVLGYVLMIIATSLLAYCAMRYSHLSIISIGNVLTTKTSEYFINRMEGDDLWYSYFTPLTPFQFFVFISFLNIIPQGIAIRIAKRDKRAVENT